LRKGFFIILSAVFLFFSFPPFNLFFLAWISPLPLVFSDILRKKRSCFLAFFIWGALFYLASLYWLPGTIMRYGECGYFPAVLAYLGLSFYLSLYFGLWGLLIYFLREKSLPWCVCFSIPLVALEFLRTHLLSGFPWLLIAYSQVSFLFLIQIANITGVWGVSFIVAWISGVIASLLESFSFRSLLLLLLPVFAVIYGAYCMGVTKAEKEKLKITVVQPNIPAYIKLEKEKAEAQLDLLSDFLERSCPKADLVIFPESSFPYYLFQDTLYTSQFLDTMNKGFCYVLIGSNHAVFKRDGIYYHNRAYLISPKGLSIDCYDKVHLVPFGEYVPLGKFFPFLYALSGYRHGFIPGEKIKPLKFKDTSFGITICYEAIFPSIFRFQVKKGATFLVNITNDAWFGKSLAPYQHLSAAIFRAVENERWLVRSANTGISVFINPNGKLTKKSSLFKEAVLIQEIKLYRHLTLYAQLGDWLPIFCIFFLIFLFIFDLVRKL